MIQKLFITLLSLSVFGTIGFGVYDATRADDSSESDSLPVVATDVPAPEMKAGAVDNVGVAWTGSGIIASLDDVSMTLTDGTYIELGPSSYWQAQGILLQVGDSVTIEGFNNGENLHARVVTVNQNQLTVRNESGQPLWSGGAQNGGQNGTQAGNSESRNEDQLPATDWMTLHGTIYEILQNNMTLLTEDGQLVSLQLGQSRFRAEQQITLNLGSLIEVSGYWQADRFRIGTLTNIDTGERLMLLDPNGRPLWAGPGRTAGSTTGGNGNGSNGNAANRNNQ